MSRELKFRVWDNINKSYLCEMSNYYWHVPFSIYEEDIEGESNLCSLSEILNHPDKFTVQQCTGLTDSNDKEIYEGDIIVDAQKQKYEIIFNEKYAKYDLKVYGENKLSQSSYFTQTHDKKCIDVIGNIFEDKHLLEK